MCIRDSPRVAGIGLPRTAVALGCAVGGDAGQVDDGLVVSEQDRQQEGGQPVGEADGPRDDMAGLVTSG